MKAIYPKPKHLKVGDYACNRKSIRGYQGIFNIFKVMEITDQGVVMLDSKRNRLSAIDPNVFRKWNFGFPPMAFRG